MTEALERYITFRNIDCVGKSERVMERIQQHIDAEDNPFWPYFQKQRAQAHAMGFDDLRVLHNYLPTLRELLIDLDDETTLALLEDLEVTCM
ncbi:N(2)-fixation sustaining protein CowN [Rhodovastum atsumiense]|uniref:N(2)-fixation sustaining protein CowN n=1 Tax=Rhodovastum atsumiense TaxID=504468 RepID=A0A5M6J212_9PROT|nr:N(2)-fixation sustaining protein CowN [Rhodovastum atsumiense]KAA5613638.1 N(2)-fixation sustaining protein CowN [Rhodovastum atsumiense]CAH2599545.1 N(2)-fixation sustaining protein CowN [Rhodovastum atsumiense]